MKVVVLDGTHGNDCDVIRQRLVDGYEASGARVDVVKLEDEEIRYCTGCLNCWNRTPGLCSHQDDAHEVLKLVMHSDLVIHFTENSLGFTTSMTKKMIDRFVSLVHPHVELDQGEFHHKKRYDKYPKVGLVYVNSEGNVEDYKLTCKIFERIALNFKTTLEVSMNIMNGEEGIASETFSI